MFNPSINLAIVLEGGYAPLQSADFEMFVRHGLCTKA